MSDHRKGAPPRRSADLIRRTLKLAWNPLKSGGIVLFAAFNDEAANSAGYASLLPLFPGIDQTSPHRETQLAERIAFFCQHFFARAELAPGHYEVANYHTAYAQNGQIMFNGWDEPPLEIPDTPTIPVTLRPEHIILMRHLNTREHGGYVELIDAKRPYGDMTYYPIDIATALGEKIPLNSDRKAEFSPEALKRYTQLHREMLFAVQAFWEHARYP